MDFVEDYEKMQSKIKKCRKLENEIYKYQSKFSNILKNFRCTFEGKECYPSFISYENNSISLSLVEYRGTRLDYLVVKKFTFEEFYNEFLK